MNSDSLAALYALPLPADRTGPLYNAFSYPTKISAEAVALFVACHTQPGDHVLDVFGGSGTTAIAALLCERPTERMLALAQERGLSPQWGARNATVYELSEIGALLARVMTHAPDPQAFAAAAKRLIARASAQVPDLYAADSPDGFPGVIRQIIWSDVVACPKCGAESPYGDLRVRRDPLRFDESATCPCGHFGSTNDWARVSDEVVDPWTGSALKRRRRIPWKVYGRSSNGNWSRPATPADGLAEATALAAPLPSGTPVARLHWGDLHRSGYHQGMTHLHHLYTARNFRALAELWRAVEEEPAELQDALRLLILSYNASHSTLMTRVVLKKNSKDFVVTGAQSGVMYVSGLPVEKNIFTGLGRKVTTFTAAFSLLVGLSGEANIVASSSTDLHLADESVDYVFTDPPFGAFIPYSEINQVNELWLGRTTSAINEAIISPAQGKGVDEYRELLTAVFSEVARVLKPESEATVIFHSSKAKVWQALASSLRDSGLRVSAASMLDKTQASFKQVNGHTAVSGDPILRVSKSTTTEATSPQSATMLDLVSRSNANATSPASAREQQHKFSELIGTALVQGVPITLDAQSVYDLQGSE